MSIIDRVMWLMIEIENIMVELHWWVRESIIGLRQTRHYDLLIVIFDLI